MAKELYRHTKTGAFDTMTEVEHAQLNRKAKWRKATDDEKDVYANEQRKLKIIDDRNNTTKKNNDKVAAKKQKVRDKIAKQRRERIAAIEGGESISVASGSEEATAAATED